MNYMYRVQAHLDMVIFSSDVGHAIKHTKNVIRFYQLNEIMIFSEKKKYRPDLLSEHFNSMLSNTSDKTFPNTL